MKENENYGVGNFLTESAVTYLKKYYIGNVVESILYIGLLIGNLLLFFKTNNIYIFLILFFAVILLNVRYKTATAAKTMALLSKKCDPLTFRDVMWGFLIKCKKKTASLRYYMNVAHANYHLCDAKAMGVALSMVDAGACNHMDTICYMHRQLCYCQLTGDEKMFSRWDAKFVEYGNGKMSVKEQKYYLRVAKEIEVLRALIDNDTQQILELCEAKKARTRSLAEKVHMEYEMARVLMETGAYDAAKSHVYFVVEYGNTSGYTRICNEKYLKKVAQ